MRIAPMLQRFGVSTVAIVADEIDDGLGIPVQRLTVAPVTAMRPRKVTAIAVVTRELARASSAEQLIDAELRAAVAAGTDKSFLSGLISASTPITSGHAIDDISALLAAVPLGPQSRPHFILSPSAARALSVQRGSGGEKTWPDVTPLGGSILGFPLHVTDQLAAGVGLFISADAVAANGGSVELDTSDQTTIEMANPATQSIASGSPLAPVPSSVISLFQTSSTGVKATRTFGFQVLRASGIASLTGIAWGTGSPPI
jgi:hypothetical protein